MSTLSFTIETFSPFKAQGWIKAPEIFLDKKFYLQSDSRRFEDLRVALKLSSREDLQRTSELIVYDVTISSISTSATSIRQFLTEISTHNACIIDSLGEQYRVSIYKPCKSALNYLSLTENEASICKAIISKNCLLPISTSKEASKEFPLLTNSNQARGLCAVITYAHSTGGWWKYFLRHYQNQLGNNAIYVITPKPAEFRHEDIAGVLSTNVSPFDDNLKSRCLSHLADSIRPFYRFVLVCDVDEIIEPPSNCDQALTLSEYLSQCPENSIIWSMGIDVLELDEESPFDFNKPIGSQRRLGIYNSALSKPNLSGRSVTYSGGHHFCNFRPIDLGDLSLYRLYCYHLKYASKAVRKSLCEHIAAIDYNDSRIKKYATQTLAEKHPHFSIAAHNGNPVKLNDKMLRDFHEQYLLSIEEVDDRGFFVSDFKYFNFLVDLSWV